MTDPTTETGRPLDEETAPENQENTPDTEGNLSSEDETASVVDAERSRLETLERHGMLTNAEDANRLAEIRGEGSNGEANA